MCPVSRSVSGRENLRLHQLHGGVAARHFAVARLDAEHLRTAFLALEPLPQLVRHAQTSLVLLLLLHGLATARELTLATFGDDHLGPALAALVSFSYLIGHAFAPTGVSRRALGAVP